MGIDGAGNDASQDYDIFPSYKYHADSRRLRHLWNALEEVSLPSWREHEPLRMFFHGEIGIPAGSETLLPEISEAIDRSKWFVLLASPSSAESKWVGHEIRRWLDTKPTDRMIIVLTEGNYLWDPTASAIDFEKSSAIHRELQGAFPREPLMFDMRWAMSERDPLFYEKISTLAAEIAAIVLRSSP